MPVTYTTIYTTSAPCIAPGARHIACEIARHMWEIPAVIAVWVTLSILQYRNWFSIVPVSRYSAYGNVAQITSTYFRTHRRVSSPFYPQHLHASRSLQRGASNLNLIQVTADVFGTLYFKIRRNRYVVGVCGVVPVAAIAVPVFPSIEHIPALYRDHYCIAKSPCCIHKAYLRLVVRHHVITQLISLLLGSTGTDAGCAGRKWVEIPLQHE